MLIWWDSGRPGISKNIHILQHSFCTQEFGFLYTHIEMATKR